MVDWPTEDILLQYKTKKWYLIDQLFNTRHDLNRSNSTKCDASWSYLPLPPPPSQTAQAIPGYNIWVAGQQYLICYFFSSMYCHMICKISISNKWFIAKSVLVWFFFCVCQHMLLLITICVKRLSQKEQRNGLSPVFAAVYWHVVFIDMKLHLYDTYAVCVTMCFVRLSF